MKRKKANIINDQVVLRGFRLLLGTREDDGGELIVFHCRALLVIHTLL